MNAEDLNDIAMMRLIVGFLGERAQYHWWSSAFFERASEAFISPVFSRTCLLAQSNGVTSAAGVVHDQRIGLGDVYHLFRLPEDLEIQLQLAYRTSLPLTEVEKVLGSKESARNKLGMYARNTEFSGVGPTLIAKREDIRDLHTWASIAAVYAHGFDNSTEVYPYVGGD